MSVINEIFDESQELAHAKIRKHGKHLLTILGIVAVLLSFIFYIFEIPYQDSIYRQFPIFVGVPVLAMASFNAFAMISIMTYFLTSFGVVSNSKIKIYFKERSNTKITTQAKAIVDRVDQYGQYDYSLQIDEVKKGFQYQLDNNKQETDQLKIRVGELEEDKLRKDRIIARQNRTIIQQDWDIKKLQREKKEEEQKLATKLHIQNNEDGQGKQI
jgi:hypothetical protein